MKSYFAVPALAMLLAFAAPPSAVSQVRAVSSAIAGDLLRDPGVPLTGARAANVTVVEFLDYNCPYCRKMHPVLQALIAADPNVRVLYKQWPIFGEASLSAAKVAVAAGWQGKYDVVHDAFMRTPVPLRSADKVRQVAQEREA